MKATQLLAGLTIVTLALVPVTPASDFEITGITGNGELTWQDTNTNGTYTVQWSPSLAQTNWSSDWSALSQIAATGGTIRASIPMFFRIIHRPRQSQSANLRLVSGGGQPQGPQYDFYMSRYEITTEEYAAFLNNAESHTNEERGANMHFDGTGNVFLGPSSYTMFDITDSRLTYNQLRPVGSRYAVYEDYFGHPVTGVSWLGAAKYCNWLTIQEGRGLAQRCYAEGSNVTNWHPSHLTYSGWKDGFTDGERLQWVQDYSGFRLPMDSNGGTTANYYNEFFKAAAWSEGASTTYGFGRNTIDAQDANYSGSNDPFEGFAIKTTPVGYYDGTNHSGFQTRNNGNSFGLYDLSGNVREIMNDLIQAGMQPYCRGGSWAGGTSSVDVNQYDPISNVGSEDRQTGFRVVTTSP